MTRYAELKEITDQLADDENCTVCKNTGWITCPDHLVDAEFIPSTGYRWCRRCDSAFEEAPTIYCPCQPE